MYFTVTFTRPAARVEKWIRCVKEMFLVNAPVKCVGLDCEYTTAPKNVKQKYLPAEKRRRAAVLQLSVSYENLVFQISKADGVPDLLREFLREKEIIFCGATINNNVRTLQCYGIVIPNARDLQSVIRNPTNIFSLGLYDLANFYIGTNLSKKNTKIASIRQEGWDEVPLNVEQIRYAALDARLGFEIARKYWKLVGYNSPQDRLNVV